MTEYFFYIAEINIFLQSVRAHKEAVPEVIQYGKLLKELAKEVKHCEVMYKLTTNI